MMSHLNALEIRLSHERARLAQAATPNEIAHRQVWVRQIEKEIADERKFLGLPEQAAPVEMTDDELMAELGVLA